MVYVGMTGAFFFPPFFPFLSCCDAEVWESMKSGVGGCKIPVFHVSWLLAVDCTLPARLCEGWEVTLSNVLKLT